MRQPMKLVELNRPDLLHIVRNMREWDRREIFATEWSDDPEKFTDKTLAYAGEFAWLAGTDRPIAAIGAGACWPGMWRVWMFATDDFRQIGLGLTKFVRKVMIPALLGDPNFQRAECYSMVGHDTAHAWLKVLGAQQIGPPVERYGKNGEDFLIFRWLREDGERAAWKMKTEG